MSYHVFYNSNKEVVWSTNADVSDEIKTEQANAGFSYVHTDLVDLPMPDGHYVNNAGDTVLHDAAISNSCDLGKLVIDAIINLDRPVVVAYLLFVVALFLALNLIVDIIYAALDPRVRLQGDDT